ncbi:MAG: hypothetical protein QW717_02715 [Candidatus Bathyarchaeia archaeon]
MAEKAKFFRDHAVQRMLKALKNGELSFLEPVVNYDFGVEYTKLREFGLNPAETTPILSRLCEIGVLVWETVGNLAVCPSCGSYRLLLQLHCPSCGSARLSRGAVVEHMMCGHVDVEINFRRGQDLVCPKCGKRLKAIGVDYRRPGILYKCMDCQTSFQKALGKFKCSNGHLFDEGELATWEVKAYRANPARRLLLEKFIIDVEAILQVFIVKGWCVETPAVIRGKAGVEHEFYFAVWRAKADKESRPPDVVCELVVSESIVDATAILAFWAKAIDVEAKDKIVMAVPGLDEKAKMLANCYGMYAVEAENSSELQVKAESLLRNMLWGVNRLENEAKMLMNPLENSVRINEA